jgi:hypothetical protein
MSASTRPVLLGLAAAALLAGCKGRACEGLAPQIEINVTGASAQVSKVQIDLIFGTETPLRHTFPLSELPFVFELGSRSRYGSMSVTALALDASGKVIAIRRLDGVAFNADGCNRLEVALLPGGGDGGVDAPRSDRPHDLALAPDKPLGPCSSRVKDPPQSFGKGMFGCPASEPWANRAGLCGQGYYVCTALDWIGRRGVAVPEYNYWTDDNLHVNGTQTTCWVSTSTATLCSGSTTTMRVCTPTVDTHMNDKLGNTCAWRNCGYGTTAKLFDAVYFGGYCETQDTNTAGALCCLDPCPSFKNKQKDFLGGMIGCPAAVSFAARKTVCELGYLPCSAQEYVDNSNGAKPTVDYWTGDELCFKSGDGGVGCWATPIPPACGGKNARVCGSQQSTCSTSPRDCGWNSATPSYYFGPYASKDDSAGVLCCPIP